MAKDGRKKIGLQIYIWPEEEAAVAAFIARFRKQKGCHRLSRSDIGRILIELDPLPSRMRRK